MEERRRGFALSGTRRSAYRKVAHRGDARCDARDADVQFPYRIDEFRQMVVSAIDQPFSLFFSLSLSPLFFFFFSPSLLLPPSIDLFRPESGIRRYNLLSLIKRDISK